MELKKKVDNAFLSFVSKPGRYVGNEYNAVNKDPESVKIRAALCFTDVYESGLRNVTFEALYHLLNAEADVWAERIYTPWTDAEALLNDQQIPLFSLESKTALSDFLLAGFYFQDRLSYTNFLTMLHLGGLQFRAAERPDDSPLLIGFGPAMSNPEPVAPFLDAVIVGASLDSWLAVARELQGADPTENKSAKLARLAEIPGVYIPSLYQPVYNDFQELQGIERQATYAPDRIQSSNGEQRRAMPSTAFEPLLPLGEITYQSNGAGSGREYSGQRDKYWEIPNRLFEPSAPFIEGELFYEIQKNIRKTGPGRIEKLMSFDRKYSESGWMQAKEISSVNGQKISLGPDNIRFSILRDTVDSFYNEMRENEFVLQPLSGSGRLRHVVNVQYREQALLDALKAVSDSGWPLVRMNFIIGLPTEKDSDIDSTIALIKKCAAVVRDAKACELVVSLEAFSPKPHTPFQWEKQESQSALRRKFEKISNACNDLNIRCLTQHPETVTLKTVLARGDRKLAAVIENAWQAGARFDSHDEGKNSTLWAQAFEKAGIPRQNYLLPISITVALPWDHIDLGVDKGWLKEEKLMAHQAKHNTANKDVLSIGYGGMPEKDFERLIRAVTRDTVDRSNATIGGLPTAAPATMQYGRKGKKRQAPVSVIKRKVRIRYAKTSMARFLSQSDIVRVLDRSARLAKIPLVYSQGIRRNPKISYGFPLPPGIASTAEYVDIEVEIGRETDIQNRYNEFLPDGVKILQYQGIFSKVPALATVINRSTYEALLIGSTVPENLFADWMARSEALIKRPTKDGPKEINVRPYIQQLDYRDDKLFITIDTIEGKTVKITEVLTSLFESSNIDFRQFPVQRTGQFITRDDTVLTPFDIL